MRCLAVVLLFSGGAGLAASRAAEPPSWPQFRGPSGAAVAAGGSRYPAQIGPDQNVLWKIAAAAGPLLAGRLGRPHLSDRRPRPEAADAGPRPRHRQGPVGSRGALPEAGKDPSDRQPCPADAGHRRRARRQLLRLQRLALLRHGRQAAVASAAGPVQERPGRRQLAHPGRRLRAAQPGPRHRLVPARRRQARPARSSGRWTAPSSRSVTPRRCRGRSTAASRS